jgi:hypothetical protein
MKNFLILLFVLIAYQTQAQNDTITFYPKVLQTYDSAAWFSDFGRGSFNWEVGKSITNADLILNAAPTEISTRIQLGLIFLDDTIALPPQMIAGIKNRLENINNTFIIDSLQYKGFQFLAAREVPDECSNQAKKASNKLYVYGIKDVGEDFLYTMVYQLVESNTKISLWEFAKMVADNCNTIAVYEADEILHYPYTKEYALAKLESSKKEVYQTEFSHFIEKRKCLSDYYLIEFMEDYYGFAAVEELVRTQSDSTIAKQYAEAKVKSYEEHTGSRFIKKYENGYTFKEVYALRRKIRNREISLNDYFDFHNGGTRESTLKRLNELGLLEAPTELSDENVFESRYLELIRKEVFKDTLRFWHAEYMKKENSFLLRISGRAQKVHEFMLEVKADNNGGYTTQLFTLPELTDEDSKFSWNFVYPNQNEYTILKNTSDEAYYIQPKNNTNSLWVQVPLIDFGKTNIPFGALTYMNTITDFNDDILLCNYPQWKGKRKMALDSMIVSLRMNYKIDEDHDDYATYFMDDMALEVYKEELYKKSYWEDNSYLPLAIDDTSYCDTEEYISIMKQYLHPTEKIQFSDLYVQDINGDSINDVFQFAVSNGKLLHYRMFTLQNGTLKELKSKKAQKLIENFSDFKNLKAESLKGNFYDDKTFREAYKDRVLYEDYGFPSF